MYLFSIFTPLSPCGFSRFPLVLCYYVFLPEFVLILPREFSLPPSHTALIYRTTFSLPYPSAWFPPTTTHVHYVLFHLQLCSISPVPPIPHPHSPLTQSQHNSILSLHGHTQHRTSSLPPITDINRTGIPIDLCHGTAALLKFDETHHWKERTKFNKCTNFQSHRPKNREVPLFWQF